MDLRGVIIEESLDDKSILKQFNIEKTEVETVTEEFGTPWLKKWTLHHVVVPEKDAERLAKLIGKHLDYSHKSSWYADYRNKSVHYIIFRERVFKVDPTSAEEYRKVSEYGISLGIPEHQVDFKPDAAKS